MNRMQVVFSRFGNIKSKIYGRTNIANFGNKHIQTSQTVRLKSDTTVTATTASSSKYEELDQNFENTIQAFKIKKNSEVIRALFVYEICSYEYIVANNTQIMKKVRRICGDTIFAWLMKITFYGHFVAGEDEYKIKPLLDRINSFGVKPILDYSVEDDLSSEEAKELDKKSLINPGGKEKQFQYNEKFADRRYKVESARTFFYKNEAACERNMENFLRCLEALTLQSSGVGITALKLTALVKPQLLLQLSETIIRTRKYVNELLGGEGSVLTHHVTREEFEKKIAASKFDDQKQLQQFLDEIEADKDGIIHLFPWTGVVNENHELNNTFLVPDLKTGKMVKLISQLSNKEEEMFQNMIRRLNTIVKSAEIMGSRIMVDAEHTYFQPAISRITVEFMRKYNKDKAIVYNTYQTYLKHTFREIKADLEQAKRQKFHFGAKIVRGAYLEHERERATAMGYEDPTNPSYEATSEMYHSTLDQCMKEAVLYKNSGVQGQNPISVMAATHNEDTVRFALNKLKEYNIKPDDKIICFGQLLGMCDFITFPLGQAGYSAFKYIPYGPVLLVLPYLSRRAIENRGILAKVAKEKRLLRKELFRRLRTGQIWYTPKGNYTPV